MSERSGGRERTEQSGASERVSGASERANGRASGPVLTSLFLFDPDHSAMISAFFNALVLDLYNVTNCFINCHVLFIRTPQCVDF